ncbi:MAG: glycerophosphodiester phosphodiesterase [Acetobacteraceae bacterium]|nr:glycerophosphodiester phosphodiesterase [Acetobacteraceae bacterium]
MTRPVEIHGHRGARGLFPENTLQGFARALAIGVDALELDVGMTADGVVVVTHDPRLSPDITRGPDGRWLAAPGKLIQELAVADLAAYDVGRIDPASPYHALFPGQAPCDGARIPTLSEVLHAFPGARISIELKTFADRPDWTARPEAMAEAVIGDIERAGAAGRVLIESFDWRGPRYVRAVRPDIRVGWLTSASVTDAELWRGIRGGSAGSIPQEVAAEGGPVWGPDHRDLTEALVSKAHRLGLLVAPWTVNAPADMRRLAGWGVDALVTDRPDLARDVLAGLGPPFR